MTKEDLLKDIKERMKECELNVSRAEVNCFLKSLKESVVENVLENDETINIKDFIKFTSKIRKGRSGTTPNGKKYSTEDKKYINATFAKTAIKEV